MLSALNIAEARKATLEVGLAVADAPALWLIPNLAEVYREKVAALRDALAGDDAAATREQLRGLVDAVRLVPSPDHAKASPAGVMAAAGQVERHAPQTTRPPDAFASGGSVSVVAGARNQLDLLTRG